MAITDALSNYDVPTLIGTSLILTLTLLVLLSSTYSLPTLQNSRILLLTAHPDDESMFFAPALTSLLRAHNNNQVKILCLSSGDAEGLGETRAKELQRAAGMLGLDGARDVVLVDDPAKLPDGMDEVWDEGVVAGVLHGLFKTGASSSSSSSSAVGGVNDTKDSTKHKKSKRTQQQPSSTDPNGAPPTIHLDSIVTFDAHGVSGHPNHKSCHAGAVTFARSLTRPGWERPISVYALHTTSILRKYASVLDVPVTMVLALARVLIGRVRATHSGGTTRQKRSGKEGEKGRRLDAVVSVAAPWEWWRGVRAMVGGHWSQMVWFRWGWVGIGRYMVVNELRRVTL